MTDERIPDDTYTTGGERFRIPAHADMVAALGRALWNFLAMEEGVVAILSETGRMDLDKARSLMAGAKEDQLKALRKKLRNEGCEADILQALDRGIEAFGNVRRTHRNALLHAGMFTVGQEDDGTYLPGLSHTDKELQRREIAREAKDLLAIAHEIEEASSTIEAAREAIADC